MGMRFTARRKVHAIVAALVRVFDNHALVISHVRDLLEAAALLEHPLQVGCVVVLQFLNFIGWRASLDGVLDGKPLRLAVSAFLIRGVLGARLEPAT